MSFSSYSTMSLKPSFKINFREFSEIYRWIRQYFSNVIHENSDWDFMVNEIGPFNSKITATNKSTMKLKKKCWKAFEQRQNCVNHSPYVPIFQYYLTNTVFYVQMMLFLPITLCTFVQYSWCHNPCHRNTFVVTFFLSCLCSLTRSRSCSRFLFRSLCFFSLFCVSLLMCINKCVCVSACWKGSMCFWRSKYIKSTIYVAKKHNNQLHGIKRNTVGANGGRVHSRTNRSFVIIIFSYFFWLYRFSFRFSIGLSTICMLMYEWLWKWVCNDMGFFFLQDS